MIKKWLVLLPLVLAVASCIRVEDLSYDGIESVQVRTMGVTQGVVDIYVNASNASGTAVKLVRAELSLSRGDRPLLRASVDEKVTLPRKFDGTIRIPVKARFEGGMLGALGVMATLSKGAQGTTVSGEVVMKAGLARKKFAIKDMDTDRFLRQFGIDLSEIMEEYGL